MGLARPKDQTYLKQLFHAGIAAVDARGSVARCLQNGGALFQIDRVRPDRSFPENIWILGAGKATAAMASATEEFLVEDYPDRYAGGLVVVKDGHGLSLERVRCLEAGHPLPDERGEKAASALLRLAESADHGDLILFLLSGGASALLPAPAGCITLSDKIMLTDT
ncbi:MAG: DUF4147 domain-containing protein, partial [Fidelibacterota bacterium]